MTSELIRLAEAQADRACLYDAEELPDALIERLTAEIAHLTYGAGPCPAHVLDWE